MKKLFRRYVALTLAMIMLFACAADAFAATLTLPKNLKAIEPEAFHGATALDEVVLPEGITAIGSRAFADSSLKSINLPRSLTSIADDAFENSPNLTAIVKAGSYAQTYCEQKGIAHEVEGAVVPPSTTGIPVSVRTEQTTLNMGQEGLELTFSSDNGEELGEDDRYHYSIVFLNADGEVVDATNYGDHEFGTWEYWFDCAGAAKIVITIVRSDGTYPGAHPSVTVDVVGSDSYVYYDMDVQGRGYPGGDLSFSLVAKNADKLSGTKNVTLTDEKGTFTKTGTISADNPKFITDFTIPADWVCYNEKGEENDYELRCTVGDETLEYHVYVEPLVWPWMDVREGGWAKPDVRLIPSEMPYTYAVADTSIATIDEAGFVTGVKAGTTTGTLTTKNGISYDFEITVLEASSSGDDPEASPSEPIFYVTAASDSIMEGEDDVEIFHIRSEVENSLLLDEELEYILRFYDEDGELIEEIWDYRWINTDDYAIIWTDWNWWYDFVEPGQCSSIEFAFGDTDYEVTEPSTARVNVLNPESLGKLSFSMGNNWGNYSVGDKVTIPLTCTTPNLLAQKGSATVKPVALYSAGLDIIRDVQVAAFDEDTLSASVSFTVGEDVLPGGNYSIGLYCGAEQVGRYNMEIFSGLSRTGYELNMLVGDSRKLPIHLAEGSGYDNVYFDIVDNPDVISIDSDGVVTALKEGFTEVTIYYDCGYGQTGEEWISVYVYEPQSENLPTMTVTLLADEAVYGGTVPVKVQLSEPLESEYGDPEVYFGLRTFFLDKNKNLLTDNGHGYAYPSQELAGEGVTVNLNIISGGSEIYKAKYLTIAPYDNNEVGSFLLDYEDKIIPLAGVPEMGETHWSLVRVSREEISRGSWVSFEVYRMPQENGEDTEISVCDAEGNVLWSGTYRDGNWSSWLDFDTDSFEIGQHTVYLYADGEKVEGASATFTIGEPDVHLSGFSNRMGVGNTSTLEYYYNTDYDCEVTFSSSNPQVAAITDGNRLTALATGQTVIAATCAHGKSADTLVTVYNSDSTLVPEIYLLPYEDQEIGWMNYMNLILGTEDDIVQIPVPSLNVSMNVQLLDEDGDVLYDQYEMGGGYYSMHFGLNANEFSTGWNNTDMWEVAAELGARDLRFEIVPNEYSNNYTVDPDRGVVTYELPPLDEYRYPVVTVDYPNIIPAGGTIDVTFTCQNPNSLKREREVILYDTYGDVLASDYLTAENPIVTLSYDPGENFTSGYFEYEYPMYENGSRTRGFNVRVSSYNGLGYDIKMSTGDTRYMYPDYSGSMPMLTVTSSDESVATAVLYGSYAMNGMARDGGYVIVTAVGAGTATITGTDQYGVSHSFKVVVYDRSSSITPTLGIDMSSCGQVQWEGSYNLALVTDNEPHTFGSPSVLVQMDYLDAEGGEVDSVAMSPAAEEGFLEKTDIVSLPIDASKMAEFYGRGARSIRFTLMENGYANYVVDENAATMTVAIADPNESEEPIIFYDIPDYSIAGSAFDVTFTCMNPDTLGEGVGCSVKGNFDDYYTDVLLTPDSPSASISVNVPEGYDGSYYSFRTIIGDQGSKYGDIDLLHGHFRSWNDLLSVGYAYQYDLYLDNMYDELTVVWESSNPVVATVDQSGLVTAVSAGMADIMAHYGPLTVAKTMRVYDPYGEHIVPELYIVSDNELSEIVPNGAAYFYFGTDSDLSKLGSSVSVEYQIEYLDADGNVVKREPYNYGDSLGFTQGGRELSSVSIYDDLASHVAAGATQMRIRLIERPNYYTVDEARSSAVFQIKDPAQWGITMIACGTPVMYRGENTLHMKLVSSRTNNREEPYTLTVNVSDWNGNILLEDATATVSLNDPDAYFDVVVPDDSNGINVQCEYDSLSASGSRSYSVDLVNVTNAQGDIALSIGEQRTAEYYGSGLNAVDRQYESSDPDIATVDENGQVTAVSTGVATITTRIGRLVYTFGVRVYDPAGTYATPNLYMDADDSQIVASSGNVTLTFGTTTDITTLGGGVYVQIFCEYLNAQGEIVYKGSSFGTNVAFATDNETTATLYINGSDVNYALASGATHARFYIEGNAYNFTVDEGRESVILPLEDPDLRNYTSVSWSRKDYVAPGDEVTFNVALLSLSESDADDDFICTLSVCDSSYDEYFINRVEKTINSENRVASYTFTVPETGYERYYYVSYSVKKAGSSYSSYSSSNTMYVLSFNSTQSDMLLDIGRSQQASYSGNNLYNVTRSFESSNPAVATVDENGYVTGVSAGMATITAKYGSLTDTFEVRVVDPNGTFSTPALYLTTGDMQAVTPKKDAQIVVGTTTDLLEIRGYPYVQIYHEYLDADGNRVDNTTSYQYHSVALVASPEAPVLCSVNASMIEEMYMVGARQIRFYLAERPDDYTVDPARASAILPIADPSTWNYDAFAWDFYGYPMRGEHTVNIRMLSSNEAQAAQNYVCTFYVRDDQGDYIIENEERAIGAQNPVQSFTFTIPDDCERLNAGYSITAEGSTYPMKNQSKYLDIAFISSAQEDLALVVGEMETVHYGGSCLNELPSSYESSNPDVATIDHDGLLTAVAPGIATITARFGALVDTFNVRVYNLDEVEDAKLSLSVPETLTEWSWSGEGDLIITADQPIEVLGTLWRVGIFTSFIRDDGYGHERYHYFDVSMVDSNTLIIHMDMADEYMADAIKYGYNQIKLQLSSAYGNGFEVDLENNTVILPMQNPADYPDPMISLGELSSTDMVSGKTYTLPVYAGNSATSVPATVVAYAKIDGKRYDLGSVTFTPSESTEAELAITAPSGIPVSAFYLYIAQLNEDGTEKQLSSQYCYLTVLPDVTTATTLAELQSEHPYANSMSQAWAYTVEGATSLAVTFDSQTETEATSYDPLKVGSLAEFENGEFANSNFANTFGYLIGEITVDVTGDTVVIWLKTDGSVNRYGFAVSQIVATMADGSTVTITE